MVRIRKTGQATRVPELAWAGGYALQIGVVSYYLPTAPRPRIGDRMKNERGSQMVSFRAPVEMKPGRAVPGAPRGDKVLRVRTLEEKP